MNGFDIECDSVNLHGKGIAPYQPDPNPPVPEALTIELRQNRRRDAGATIQIKLKDPIATTERLGSTRRLEDREFLPRRALPLRQTLETVASWLRRILPCP